VKRHTGTRRATGQVELKDERVARPCLEVEDIVPWLKTILKREGCAGDVHAVRLAGEASLFARGVPVHPNVCAVHQAGRTFPAYCSPA
jgi:hypothetical protein